MTIAASLTVTPPSPNHGDTVTATYQVTGNDPAPGQSIPVTGNVTMGGQAYAVSATLTAPGSPALAETFDTPVAAGLTFQPTSQPNVFTAVVP